MEKISSTNHVRNEEVLLTVKEQRNILHETSKRKANWIGHIFRRNCLLQPVIEGKIKGGIEVIGKRGRRCRKLLDDLGCLPKGAFHIKELQAQHVKLGTQKNSAVIRKTMKWLSHSFNITT